MKDYSGRLSNMWCAGRQQVSSKGNAKNEQKIRGRLAEKNHKYCCFIAGSEGDRLTVTIKCMPQGPTGSA